VIEIEDTATLAARGAAALVEVTVTRPAGRDAFLQVDLSRRRGSRAAVGSGTWSSPKRGAADLTVPVLANNATFRQGVPTRSGGRAAAAWTVVAGSGRP
jgi:hypothetical protein